MLHRGQSWALEKDLDLNLISITFWLTFLAHDIYFLWTSIFSSIRTTTPPLVVTSIYLLYLYLSIYTWFHMSDLQLATSFWKESCEPLSYNIPVYKGHWRKVRTEPWTYLLARLWVMGKIPGKTNSMGSVKLLPSHGNIHFRVCSNSH